MGKDQSWKTNEVVYTKVCHERMSICDCKEGADLKDISEEQSLMNSMC